MQNQEKDLFSLTLWQFATINKVFQSTKSWTSTTKSKVKASQEVTGHNLTVAACSHIQASVPKQLRVLSGQAAASFSAKSRSDCSVTAVTAR